LESAIANEIVELEQISPAFYEKRGYVSFPN